MSSHARTFLEEYFRSRTVTAIKVLSALAVVGLGAFFAYVILDAKRDAEANANSAAANLTTALAQDISRNFELYDLSLQGVIHALKEPTLSAASIRVRQLALFDFASKARYLNRIAIIDAGGRMIEQSRSGQLPNETFLDREYFKAHQNATDDILYVSKPLQSRVDQEWIITLSRRITNTDGSFGGVVAGSLSLGYFQSLFMKLRANEGDAFAIVSTEGTLINRQPFRLMEVGKDLRSSPLFDHFPREQVGIYRNKSVIDGVARVYSFARVPNFPLIVTSASSESELFAAWKQKAIFMGMIMLLLTAALVTLGYLLLREFNLRLKAEIKLAATAARLDLISRTDSLTGLKNRRAFDDLTKKEWKRAIRERAVFSLLVLDVDHFKKFNDLHGHLAGDAALALVGDCILKHIKRPADFAARYGGEEFAVGLPGTLNEGAQKVADDIRKSIALAHLSGKLAGKITVSIGITSILPSQGMQFADAFAAADRALYRAKERGRDRLEFEPVGHSRAELQQS